MILYFFFLLFIQRGNLASGAFRRKWKKNQIYLWKTEEYFEKSFFFSFKVSRDFQVRELFWQMWFCCIDRFTRYVFKQTIRSNSIQFDSIVKVNGKIIQGRMIMFILVSAFRNHDKTIDFYTLSWAEQSTAMNPNNKLNLFLHFIDSSNLQKWQHTLASKR